MDQPSIIRVHNWIARHKRHWPRNFDLLQKSFNIEIDLEIFPEVKFNKKLVWVCESDINYSPAELEPWTELFSDKTIETIVTGDSSFSIKRINKDLLPFL